MGSYSILLYYSIFPKEEVRYHLFELLSHKLQDTKNNTDYLFGANFDPCTLKTP